MFSFKEIIIIKIIQSNINIIINGNSRFNSTLLFRKQTKKFMSDFRDIHSVFSDFITDFGIFSDDENETKKGPQFYLERDIKNYYENEYKLFKNDMNTYINIFTWFKTN